MTKFTFESDEEGITSVSVRISYKGECGQGLLSRAKEILSNESGGSPIEVKTKSSILDSLGDKPQSKKESKSSSSSSSLFDFKPKISNIDASAKGSTPPPEMTDFSKF